MSGCPNWNASNIYELYIIPLILTLLFAILILPSTDNLIAVYVSDLYYRLVFKIILFLVLSYIIIRLFPTFHPSQCWTKPTNRGKGEKKEDDSDSDSD